MKKFTSLLLFLAWIGGIMVLLSIDAFGQTLNPGSVYFGESALYSQFNQFESGEVVSTNDTTVLNKGLIECDHKWAYQIKKDSMISCAVWHGESGCPDNWNNDFRICKSCLRHENIRETRTVKVKPDEYSESLKKLKQ